MANETQALAVAQGEFWMNRRTGERVQVREVRISLVGADDGVMLTDMAEGPDIDLGWRGMREFLAGFVRLGTLDEAHEEAVALDHVDEGEFWKSRTSGNRVEIVRTDLIDGGWVRVIPIDLDSGSIRWLSVSGLLRGYRPIGSLDGMHAAALLELGMETCDECDGTAQGDYIDAPDFKGYAKCPACERGMVALG